MRYVFRPLLEKDASMLNAPGCLRVADKPPARGNASRTLRDLPAMLRWAATRDLAPDGVLQNVKLQHGGQRDHVPTIEEIRLAWRIQAPAIMSEVLV
ncbi:hypothetical protein [Mangrovicoccus ximenensis]|uniref:hypothetical protein n=1 Tax=Mangrovicoccus ximenensis TaxID=1911570 RepID=UPI001374BBB5|nr:hypothetical protein [Mangrovicoccus ximenensis]